MEELVKSVQKKYVDDIVNKYPIHRFFVLFIVIIDVHLTFNVKTESVYTTLSEMKVNYLIDVKSGLLSQVSIVQLILSCFLTFVIIAKLNSYFSEFFSKCYHLVKILIAIQKKYLNELIGANPMIYYITITTLKTYRNH